jgi:hypothetical protein
VNPETLLMPGQVMAALANREAQGAKYHDRNNHGRQSGCPSRTTLCKGAQAP